MTPVHLILGSCLLFLSMSFQTRADGNYRDIDISQAQSIDEAVEIISTTLEQQRFDIVAVINHAQNASNVGLDLLPTQVILFRKRFFDMTLTRRSRTAAIDLPMKILIFEDAAGDIKLKYNDVGYIVDRHEVLIRDFPLFLLDIRMDQFGLNDNGIITVPSNQSVADTTNKLQDLLSESGFFIPFVINFSGANPRLRDTTLMIFGNPNVGTLLMQNSQEIGLDLPQKYLVYEDKQGQVQIAYNNPRFIARRAGIQGLDTLLNNISNNLDRIAKEGAIL